MKKINRHVIAIIASLAFLIIISLGLFGSVRARKIINTDEEKYAKLYLKEQQASIDEVMKNLVYSVDILAVTTQQEMTSKDVITDDAKRTALTNKMQSILKSVSEKTTGAVYSYLRFNPSLAPSTSGLFMEKDMISNRFVNLTPTDFSLYNENDIEHVGWYYIPVRTGKATWMAPYKNDNVDLYMISYVIPLFVNDEAVGVIGMDIDFAYITNVASVSSIYKNGYLTILNSNQEVQYHPTVAVGDVFTTPKSCYSDSAVLENGMTLSLVIPKKEIYNSGNKLLLEISISLGFIFILYLACLALFMHGITRREKEQAKLNNEINSVAGIYVSMHKIYVRKNQIKEYYALEYLSGQFKRNFPRVKDLLLNLVKQNVNEDNQEMMREFLNVDTLPMRMNDKKSISLEFQARNYGWCRARFIRIDGESVSDEVVFAIEQINDEKEKENHLLYLSETDLMTGLKNRGSGEKHIRNLISKHQKGAFLLMDIDKFKKYNDTYGHAAGDQVIIGVAETLLCVFGDKNIVMRLGGDEFAVFLVGTTTEEEIKQRLYVLFAHLENLRIESIRNTAVYLSLGISLFDGTNYDSFDALYHDADEATYRSKDRIGNSYSFHKNK